MTLLITDPSARPRDRFLQVVSSYFENQGYIYKKSKKGFIIKFDKGYKTIGFFFRISTLTTVTLNWSIHFEKFQKLLGFLFEDPKRYKKSDTIGSDLCNFTRNADMAFPLYNELTLTYDDLSINRAAALTISAFEEYTIPYFENFCRYKNLEKHFNTNGSLMIQGIILARYLENPAFDTLVDELYRKAQLREKLSPSNELAIIDKTISYLKANNIKDILD